MANTKVPVELVDLDGGVVINESSADVDFRVESNGNANMLFVDGGNDRIHIGTATNVPVTGINPPLQISGTDYASSTLGINRFSNDNTAAFLVLGKSRGTSVGSYTSVNSGDIVGALLGVAADGTDMASNVARIDFAVDTTPGGNDTPGRIVFNTTADGAVGVTERMRIHASGGVSVGSTTDPGDGVLAADNFTLNGGGGVKGVGAINISTTATAITAANDFGSLVIVAGNSGGNMFSDLVFYATTDGATVIAGGSVSGSPQARTYSVVSSILKLAMASGTYSVSATTLQGTL